MSLPGITMGNADQGGTRRYAVVGDPVAHSLSPPIHNAWIAAAALNAHYGRIHLQSDNAVADLRAMTREYAGLNVTLPYKVAAANASVRVEPLAARIGAANTLVNDRGDWVAYNTDVKGFEAAVRETGCEPGPGLNVILIGAGGAARAAVTSLHEAGARITILNRSVDNANALARDLASRAETGPLDELTKRAETADLIVNSASLGHAGAILPALPPGRARAFLDLSYGKAAAPTLEAAARAGWVPHDGLTMLVAQAAAAFHLWFGIHPDQAGVLAACRAEVARRA
jgi:shikimate dehydrogenase